MSVGIARANVERYGNYPLSSTFASNDNVTDLGDTAQPAYSAAFDPNDGIKRHAACDECRMPIGAIHFWFHSDTAQGSAN